MLYLAYGSNLNVEEMKQRCPSAKYIGSGVVKGYTLVFRYYLSVDESDDDVIVGVWEVDETDMYRLDYYEGFPNLYTKKVVKCLMENGNEVYGTIYIMNKNQYPLRKPSDSYFIRCMEGYLDLDINYTQLLDAFRTVK